MGLLSRLFGKKMSRDELFYEIGTRIFNEVHGKFTLKIMQGIGGDCDGNSENEAYMEVTDMILRGDLDRNDFESICQAYMRTRENIIINHGGKPRWVAK
jgi:hypothetical protein